MGLSQNLRPLWNFTPSFQANRNGGGGGGCCEFRRCLLSPSRSNEVVATKILQAVRLVVSFTNHISFDGVSFLCGLPV